MPKHGHLGRSWNACGVCRPCPEPADGASVGPAPSPTGSRTPGWIRRPSCFCASSERHYRVKSQSLQKKRLISACLNHSCQLLSWISLIYHASLSPLASGQRVVFLLNQNASLLPSHLLAVEVRVNTVKVFCSPCLLSFKQNSAKAYAYSRYYQTCDSSWGERCCDASSTFSQGVDPSSEGIQGPKTMASKQCIHSQQQRSPGKTENLPKMPFNQANISLHFFKSIVRERQLIATRIIAHWCPVSQQLQPFKPFQMGICESLFRASPFYHPNLRMDCDQIQMCRL